MENLTSPSHTQAVFPPLSGCGDSSVMASLWADVQLGMWDAQAGIPGKARQKKKSMGKECCIDRKVLRGNSRYVCVGKTEDAAVGRHYHLWLEAGVFDLRAVTWGRDKVENRRVSKR